MVSMNTLSKTPHDAQVRLQPTRYYWYCEDTDRRKTFAAAGFLDSRAHTSDPESFIDTML